MSIESVQLTPFVCGSVYNVLLFSAVCKLCTHERHERNVAVEDEEGEKV